MSQGVTALSILVVAYQFQCCDNYKRRMNGITIPLSLSLSFLTDDKEGTACSNDCDGDGIKDDEDNYPCNKNIHKTDFRKHTIIALDPEGKQQADPDWQFNDDVRRERGRGRERERGRGRERERERERERGKGREGEVNTCRSHGIVLSIF